MLSRALVNVLRTLSRGGESVSLKPSDVHSILVVELTRLGDVVTMLPAVPMLRMFFPQASIHVIVDERYASLLNGLTIDAEVCGIPRPGTHKGLFAAVGTARALHTDLALSMSPPRRNAAVTLASGSRARVGYLGYADTYTPFLGIHKVESFGVKLARDVQYAGENIEIRPLKVCSALGIESTNTPTRIFLREEKVEPVRLRMRLSGAIPSGEYIVVHPFSGWRYRTWDLKRFITLVERVLLDLGREVVFVSSGEEHAWLDPLRRQFAGNQKVHFLASDDLVETAVVIEGASLFLGNDSGPLHLAAGLGVNVVGLYGPAAPSLTAPRSAAVASLYKQVECSPCDQRQCIRPRDPCIGLISVDEVYVAVKRGLSLANQKLAVTHG